MACCSPAMVHQRPSIEGLGIAPAIPVAAAAGGAVVGGWSWLSSEWDRLFGSGQDIGPTPVASGAYGPPEAPTTSQLEQSRGQVHTPGWDPAGMLERTQKVQRVARQAHAEGQSSVAATGAGAGSAGGLDPKWIAIAAMAGVGLLILARR